MIETRKDCPDCGGDAYLCIAAGFNGTNYYQCDACGLKFSAEEPEKNDPVNAPSHYIGKIECIDYLRDKLTKEEFTGFCMGNVLKYSSRWRKKDGLQDLKKAKVYLEWAIENEEESHD